MYVVRNVVALFHTNRETCSSGYSRQGFIGRNLSFVVVSTLIVLTSVGSYVPATSYVLM